MVPRLLISQSSPRTLHGSTTCIHTLYANPVNRTSCPLVSLDRYSGDPGVTITMDANENKAQEHAVSLKLPTFWTSQPQVWFEQAEAQFHIRQITADATRYYYVVSALDQDTGVHVIDFLRHPPDDNKYEGIKKLLNNTFGASRRARASKLLRMFGLGDRKPSVLMNEMLAQMDGRKPCLLCKQVFLE